MDRIESRSKTSIHTNKQWSWKFPIHRDISRKLSNHTIIQRDNYKFRHRHNKYLHAIGCLFKYRYHNSAYAADVGGVSATANPIANSSDQLQTKHTSFTSI